MNLLTRSFGKQNVMHANGLHIFNKCEFHLHAHETHSQTCTQSKVQIKANRREYYTACERFVCVSVMRYRIVSATLCCCECTFTRVWHIRNKVENHTQMAKLYRSTCITFFFSLYSATVIACRDHNVKQKRTKEMRRTK